MIRYALLNNDNRFQARTGDDHVYFRSYINRKIYLSGVDGFIMPIDSLHSLKILMTCLENEIHGHVSFWDYSWRNRRIAYIEMALESYRTWSILWSIFRIITVFNSFRRVFVTHELHKIVFLIH